MSTFEANYLRPQQVLLRRTATGVVEMILNGKRYPSVRIYSAYPLKQQKMLVSVRDALDEDEVEIGIIADVTKLEENSRRIVEEELERRYFVPVITRVISLKEEGIRQFWEVETDRGPRKFVVKDPYEHIRQVAPGRLLITDTHECRYEIADVARLDNASRELLSRHIYF